MKFFAWFDHIKQFYFSSQKKFFAISAMIVLFLVFIIKACSNDLLMEPTYVIGLDNMWPGLSLQGKEQNLTEFNHHLLTQMGKVEGIHFRSQMLRQHLLYSSLESGKIQGILTMEPPNPSQRSKFLFSNSYFLTGPVLIIPNHISFVDWKKLPQKTIAVRNQPSTYKEMELDSTIELKFYSNILEAFNDLKKGRVDGAIFPAILAHVHQNTFYENELKIVTPPFGNEGIFLVTKKNAQGEALIEHFNRGLVTLKDQGMYQELLKQWGLVDVDDIQP